MNSVKVYRGAVPTTRGEILECSTPLQRVLSLYVTNTTTGNLSFTFDVDQNGTVYEALTDIPVHGSSAQKDTFEFVPGRFLLTRATRASSGLGTVGDIVGLTASDTGLVYHLAVEILGGADG